MRVVVKNGTIVSPVGRYRADVLCEDGRITAVESCASTEGADDVVDANGCFVFPGFIDPHVHSRDPRLTHKEDFAHSTQAAAAGGITTLLDMPNTLPPVDDIASFRAQVEHHERNAFVDFGLWSLAVG